MHDYEERPASLSRRGCVCCQLELRCVR